jgi:hypothetical protein
VRTSFHHQSEAQPPNGTLTAATSPDTPSYMPSHAVTSPRDCVGLGAASRRPTNLALDGRYSGRERHLSPCSKLIRLGDLVFDIAQLTTASSRLRLRGLVGSPPGFEASNTARILASRRSMHWLHGASEQRASLTQETVDILRLGKVFGSIEPDWVYEPR